MVIKALLIVAIVAILMEDGSTIRKSEEEKREEKELAELVNKTLAEEAEKEEEEKKKKQLDPEKKEDETKKEKNSTDKKESGEKKRDVEDQDKACPPANFSCPVVKPCQPCHECPAPEDCPPVEECGPCPEVRPCSPCGPASVGNHTSVDQPPTVDCTEVATMSVPVALVVGASAGVLVTGVATAIGLILRYVDPIVSGFFFVATVVLIWYFSSHYPETARELGGRAATLLREAATALSHRIVEALRHHNEQVGVPVLISSFLLPDLSSMFEEKFALRFSM
jgi:hypothetical protein